MIKLFCNIVSQESCVNFSYKAQLHYLKLREGEEKLKHYITILKS